MTNLNNAQSIEVKYGIITLFDTLFQEIFTPSNQSLDIISQNYNSS
jgi:hypothetical protein